MCSTAPVPPSESAPSVVVFRLAETQCILQARNPVKSWPRWIAGTMPPQALPSHPTSVVSAAPPLRTVRNGLEETRLQHTSEPGN